MANPRVKSSYVAGEVRASVVAALLAARRAQVLPTWRVRSAATELGVSVRTVWRWLEVAESEDRLGRKSRPCFAVGQDDLVELAYYRGNVSALRVARIAEGTPTPSIGAFRAAFARVLPPGRRAGLVSGERARRDFDTYLPLPPGRHRNDCWEADHTQLAVHVRLPDGRVVMPWATLFLDRATRALWGWAIAVTREPGKRVGGAADGDRCGPAERSDGRGSSRDPFRPRQGVLGRRGRVGGGVVGD